VRLDPEREPKIAETQVAPIAAEKVAVQELSPEVIGRSQLMSQELKEVLLLQAVHLHQDLNLHQEEQVIAVHVQAEATLVPVVMAALVLAVGRGTDNEIYS
jgi:hypothetical protein